MTHSDDTRHAECQSDPRTRKIRALNDRLRRDLVGGRIFMTPGVQGLGDKVVSQVLLEIMVLCYRMLFVFSEALHDTRTAQAARLGYATPALTLRSLGSLTANLTLQIWQRAHALHIAAQSRNNDGAFRFLEPEYANTRRDLWIAGAGGVGLIAAALGLA